jgi:hypothetical protein
MTMADPVLKPPPAGWLDFRALSVAADKTVACGRKRAMLAA